MLACPPCPPWGYCLTIPVIPLPLPRTYPEALSRGPSARPEPRHVSPLHGSGRLENAGSACGAESGCMERAGVAVRAVQRSDLDGRPFRRPVARSH